MKFENDHFRFAATDLSNHLSCAHLTQLERRLALRQIGKPAWYDPALEVLIQRGRDHEAAYVAYLREQGRTVRDLRGQPQEATMQAMKDGIDVIVQARLEEGDWMGYVDILIKVAGESLFGGWSYEVQDTKLAQNTRAGTVLQLCLYTDLLSQLQGALPERMAVVKPGDGFPAEEYRFADFQAYYRLVRNGFTHVMNRHDAATYPDPVAFCNICRWWQVCDKQRHDDDHLSLVAGLHGLHIAELNRQGIQTLEKFATAELQRPARGNADTFNRRQHQAKVQLRGRVAGRLLYENRPAEQERGLNRLPLPNEGDVWFDLEGDPFFEDGGLEYLIGYAFLQEGQTTYRGLWSVNRTEERLAFKVFMEFIMERWRKHPHMHLYHFTSYEPSALKRLARVHACFEIEIDELLRGRCFVDLHAAFRESLFASVETYSLKELERFAEYERVVALHDASSARKSTEIALEMRDFASLPKEAIKRVEQYNMDDCLATAALHRWLEGVRTERERSGEIFTRPEPGKGEASEEVTAKEARARALAEALTEHISPDPALRSEEENAKWLLAHLVDYFRREDRSAWWEYFRVHDLEHDDLLDERTAIAGLEFVEALPRQGRERNPTHRYRYPPQEISVSEGDDLIEVNGEKVGRVHGISQENLTVDIRKSGNALDHHPRAVHAKEVVTSGELPDALMELANDVIDNGLEHAWSRHAAKDLLMKRDPVLNDGSSGAYLDPIEDPVKGAVRIAAMLDRSVLAIQGPPGTGKTYTGSRMILELVRQGKRVGITAVSHKVIRNLTLATLAAAETEGVQIDFVHKVKEFDEGALLLGITETKASDAVRSGLSAGKVACGTAWLWAEKKSEGVLDYLFVDEAGQMSLSHVLAASRASANLILLGDPQQLEQPQRGAHPEGSDVAALTYLLDGHPTMPEGRGLFLGVTHRLNPAICAYTSEVFYEGRLTTLPGLELQVIGGGTPYDGTGLIYIPVEHKGNQSRSDEEAEAIEAIVKTLLAKGTWTNEDGITRRLTRDDILIVVPFNAQLGALRDRLPEIAAGTVDKFQGQEAPVVIYSMTSSSADDAPHGMSFLFNPNRLNVATSRARCVCILVASPRLTEPECKTIDQMRWANALCRFIELARTN